MTCTISLKVQILSLAPVASCKTTLPVDGTKLDDGRCAGGPAPY